MRSSPFQNIHCSACTTLDGIGIILTENCALGENSLIGFIAENAERAQVETSCGDDAADPEFDEGRLLGIDAEVVVPDVRDSRGNVVGLVDGKSIQAGGDGGAQNSQAEEQ